MPMQKVYNFLVDTYSSHGGYGCNIRLKRAKNKKNGEILTNKTQKWRFVRSF